MHPIKNGQRYLWCGCCQLAASGLMSPTSSARIPKGSSTCTPISCRSRGQAQKNSHSSQGSSQGHHYQFHRSHSPDAPTCTCPPLPVLSEITVNVCARHCVTRSWQCMSLGGPFGSNAAILVHTGMATPSRVTYLDAEQEEGHRTRDRHLHRAPTAGSAQAICTPQQTACI